VPEDQLTFAGIFVSPGDRNLRRAVSVERVEKLAILEVTNFSSIDITPQHNNLQKNQAMDRPLSDQVCVSSPDTQYPPPLTICAGNRAGVRLHPWLHAHSGQSEQGFVVTPSYSAAGSRPYVLWIICLRHDFGTHSLW